MLIPPLGCSGSSRKYSLVILNHRLCVRHLCTSNLHQHMVEDNLPNHLRILDYGKHHHICCHAICNPYTAPPLTNHHAFFQQNRFRILLTVIKQYLAPTCTHLQDLAERLYSALLVVLLLQYLLLHLLCPRLLTEDYLTCTMLLPLSFLRLAFIMRDVLYSTTCRCI